MIPPTLATLSMTMMLLHPSLLPFGFILAGGAVGTFWASTVLVVRATYACPHIGKHYNFLYTAGLLSPFPLNYYLFGSFYDAEASRQNNPNGGCNGVACISTAFGVLLALNAVGMVAAVTLHVRRRRLGHKAMEQSVNGNPPPLLLVA